VLMASAALVPAAHAAARPNVASRLRRRQSNVRTRAAPSTASIATSSLSDTPPDAPADPYAALKGCTVHHAPTGELVDLATRIDTSPGQTTVVAFMRSFG